MDKRYEVYALADRHFYETPDRLPVAHGEPAYETAGRQVPEGWRSARVGDWLTLTPVDGDGAPDRGPTQGWKIHASATRSNAEKIAAAVWDYCVPRRIPFKFVPGPHLLHLRNTKYAGRDTSGKFATVYPADEEQLHLVLRELGAELDGLDGPYILTDLRWNDGPLYVRYGPFARSFVVDERGSLVPAVRDGRDRLVPDDRAPAFRVPDWVTLPAFLRPQLTARNSTTVGDLPYRIDKALHFSNGGGVYAGTDTRDGRKVVLKEGRPHAGLAADGVDAIARLERERTALQRVSGLGIAPEPRDWFTLGDHRFLVMDFLEGRPLNSFFAERYPLLAPDPEPAAVAAYTVWALRIHRAVEQAVQAVHTRGIVFNDLHVFNVMVSPDEESITLLDFEAAAPVEENGRQIVAHPGFFAPPDRTGIAVDRYALACLRLALFLPLTTLFVVDRDKAQHLAEIIAGQFPDIPGEFLQEAVAEIAGGTDAASPGTAAPSRGTVPSPFGTLAEPGDWPYSRDSMVKAILASATPERDDRLFPGDVAQFTDGGGLGIAHGAAGVLDALQQIGVRHEEGERWLLDHTDPVPLGTPLGLYDGLAGVAYVLDGLGHTARALDLIDVILREKWQRLSHDLRGGLAGLGLVLDRLGRTTGEREPADRAAEIAGLLEERLTRAGPERHAGLLRGWSGPALFFLRRHDITKDPALLELAAHALRLDLDRCVLQPGGSLQVDEGWRTMPYLGDGSAGIGMVIDDFLAVRDDEDFRHARSGILTAASSCFYVQPGLLQGRAGMILHLARTGADPQRLAAQVSGLGWYAMPYHGQLAFPGHQMMRLSMDLGTGTAGCLLALAAALDDEVPAQLPFLPPPQRRPPSRLRSAES